MEISAKTEYPDIWRVDDARPSSRESYELFSCGVSISEFDGLII